MCSSDAELNEELLNFIYQTPIGICETDTDGMIMKINPHMTQLLLAFIGTYDGLEIPNFFDVLSTLDESITKTIAEGIASKKKNLLDNRDVRVSRGGIKHIRIKCSRIGENTLVFIVENITLLMELEEIKQHEGLLEAHSATIFAMAKLAESRDDDTGKHLERVQKICRMLAEKLSTMERFNGLITEDYIQNIFLASPLHDIGKVGIKDNILLKPGKLTDEEFNEMKMHPIIGANTLLEVIRKFPTNNLLNMGRLIANYHHEKWDGTGYPDGLKGEDIPLAARIMALADVYDALRSKRVYKEAYSHEKTDAMILELKGTHLDPLLVEVYEEIRQFITPHYDCRAPLCESCDHDQPNLQSSFPRHYSSKVQPELEVLL